MIDKAHGAAIPTYGSSEWASLPEGDTRRVAAVVVAAESWAQDGDNLGANLRRELDAARRTHKVAEDAEYVARAAEHRKGWKPPTGPTFVQRRAAQLAEAAPRPGDRPGSSGGAA